MRAAGRGPDLDAVGDRDDDLARARPPARERDALAGVRSELPMVAVRSDRPHAHDRAVDHAENGAPARAYRRDGKTGLDRHARAENGVLANDGPRRGGAVGAHDAGAGQGRGAIPGHRNEAAAVVEPGDLVDDACRRVEDPERREDPDAVAGPGAPARLARHEEPGAVARPRSAGTALGLEERGERRLLFGRHHVEDAEVAGVVTDPVRDASARARHGADEPAAVEGPG